MVVVVAPLAEDIFTKVFVSLVWIWKKVCVCGVRKFTKNKI